MEFARLFSPGSWKKVVAEAATFEREAERRLKAEPARPQGTPPRQLAYRRYSEPPSSAPRRSVAEDRALAEVARRRQCLPGDVGQAHPLQPGVQGCASRGYRALGTMAS